MSQISKIVQLQQQIASLHQKLETSQLQFQNYKVQCKQLETFLQQQSSAKEAQIRKLKEQAIKREKNIALIKSQCSMLQSQNVNLKSIIKQLQNNKTVIQSHPNNIADQPPPSSITNSSNLNKQPQQSKTINEQAQRILKLQKQLQNTLQKLMNNNKIIKDITQQLNKRETKIKVMDIDNEKVREECEQLKKMVQNQRKKNAQIISQMNKQKQLYNNMNSNSKNSSRGTKNQKGERILQIKIQKTREVPVVINSSRSNNSANKGQNTQRQQMRQIIVQKDKQLQIMNEKAVKYLQKIKKYQNRIKQLEFQLSILHQQQEKQASLKKSHIQNLSRSKQKQINRMPDRIKTEQSKNQQQGYNQSIEEQQNQNYSPMNMKSSSRQQIIDYKPSFSILVLTKKFYTCPFLQLPPSQPKNTIKLYKTDKNGKIDKTMGSTIYKVNNISYNAEQMLTILIENMNNNDKIDKNRVILYGIKGSNKKLIMLELISRIKKKIIDIITKQYQQHNRNSMQSKEDDIANNEHIGMCYLELEDQFVKNVEMFAQNRQQIFQMFQNIQKLRYQMPKTPKKHDKLANSSYNQKKVRYFAFFCGQMCIQVITSDFLQYDMKQSQNLSIILDRIAYQKIPKSLRCHIYNTDSISHQSPKFQTQFLLTLNPIVGLYQQCKSTLTLTNYKKIYHNNNNNHYSNNSINIKNSNINGYDQQTSPYKFSSRRSKNSIRVSHMQLGEDSVQNENVRISIMQEKVQFYRNKLNELMIKLKVILNANSSVSYLKKSQNIMNYEKILKFIQSILNQGQQTQYFSPSRKSYQITQLQDLYPSP